MYWQGIPSPKIAAITGIAEGTVRYHLGVAFEADPGLRDAHKTARGPSPRPSAGLRNLNDVVAFFIAEGRLPTTGGKTARERALEAWLHRQRQLSATGAISPKHREGLSVIPDWDTGPSYQDRHEAWWEQRVQQLADYRAAENEWPRHQKTDDAYERTLGIWLHGQRISHRDGSLALKRNRAGGRRRLCLVAAAT